MGTPKMHPTLNITHNNITASQFSIRDHSGEGWRARHKKSRRSSVSSSLSSSSSSDAVDAPTCSSDYLAATQTRRTQQNQPNRCPSLRRKLLLRRGKRHHADGSDGPLTQVLANLQRCGFSPRRGQQLERHLHQYYQVKNDHVKNN